MDANKLRSELSALIDCGERGLLDFRNPLEDQPLAAEGLISYRYRVREHSHVMIGARDDAEALREAARSIVGEPDPARLEVWRHGAYRPVKG
jgi:hypothetical protein